MAMKEDIANRAFRIRMTGMIITAALAVAAIATAFLLPAGVLSAGMAKPLITGVLALAGAITTLVTMKEVKRLEIDEQYLQSYMEGKNYWGAGYRQEVAERGYSGPSPIMAGMPPQGRRASMEKY